MLSRFKLGKTVNSATPIAPVLPDAAEDIPRRMTMKDAVPHVDTAHAATIASALHLPVVSTMSVKHTGAARPPALAWMTTHLRSEERRVGKECRSAWSTEL